MDTLRAQALIEANRSRIQTLYSGKPGAKTPAVRVEALSTGATAVYVYDEIGGWDGVRAKDVVQALASIKGDIDLHINSEGGDVFEGAAIYNAFKSHDGNVTAFVDGVAASAASFIAMSADKIVMHANSKMMIHGGMITAYMLNETEMAEFTQLLRALNDSLAEMYAARTGKGTTASWRKQLSQDTWYSPEAALAAGLIDEILPNKAGTQNEFDLSLFAVSKSAIEVPDAATDVAGFAKLLKEMKFG